MRPDDTMQIDYNMNRRELAEMCVRALAEVFIKQKVILAAFLVMVIYGFFSVMMGLVGIGRGNSLEIIIFLLAFFLAYFLIMFGMNYRHFAKSGLLEPQRLRLENGYLITGLYGDGHFPCKSYSVIKRGFGIVMIGTRSSSRITSYIGIPKRAFHSQEEQEAFLWLLTNSDPAEAGPEGQPMLDKGGDMVLTFDISIERWAHIYGESVQILSDTSLLGPVKSWGSYIMIAILGFYLLVRAIAGSYSLTGYMMLFILFLAGAGVLLAFGRVRYKNSDYRYRELAAKGKIQNNTIGWWEIGIRPEGGYFYHNDKYMAFRWTDYIYRIDMGDTLFFFDKSKKRYFFIPKEVLGGQEEAAGFFDYLYQKGITFRFPSAKSRWDVRKITGVVMLALAAGLAILLIMVSIYISLTKGLNRFYEDYQYYDYPGAYEETEPFVFRPEDYPHYMPLTIQIEVLKSLGIEPPSEAEMKEYETWMEEDDYYRAYLEGTPYVGILGEMGVGIYNETTEKYDYHPSVYWFDFEGWDISEDYLDILNAIQVMGDGDFELTDMEEDLQNANWEEGTGAILVMFRYNKNAYAFEAQMMYDWIDPDIIGFFNEVLEKERNPKRIYCMDDGGQGVILFYNTKEWAGEFFKKTGITLEAPVRSQSDSWIPTNGYGA